MLSFVTITELQKDRKDAKRKALKEAKAVGEVVAPAETKAEGWAGDDDFFA